MKIKETEHHYLVEGTDPRGVFQIKAHKSLTQVNFLTEIEEWENSDYVDTHPNEIIMLRDMLNKAIENHERERINRNENTKEAS